MVKILIVNLALLVFVSCNNALTNGIYSNGELDFNFTPDNTAIVVVEFQKTWTEKCFFHWLIKKELQRKNVIESTITFLNKARQQRFTIIQAPLILDKSDKEKYKKMPFIPKLFGAFKANTWKAEYTPEIYQETDLEIEGRCGFDACRGSNLESILDSIQVDNLLFCGFTTEHCIEMTMNTLINKGYYCVLLEDCTATKSSRLQSEVEHRQKTINSKNIFN